MKIYNRIYLPFNAFTSLPCAAQQIFHFHKHKVHVLRAKVNIEISCSIFDLWL